MTTYRVYYCARDGRRFSATDFEAPDDAAAIERCRLFGVLRVPVIELWHGDRLVYRADGNSP
jgi:hypothetical protein